MMRQSLADIAPALVQEWHPTKNGAMTPQTISAGSHTKVWWQCQHDPPHVWQAYVYSRVKGSNCPHCSGRFATEATSLATLFPQLAAQWHSIENGTRTPSDVRPHSEYQAWWQCQNDSTHVWKAAVKDRVRGNRCPFCQGRKPTRMTCLQTLYPHLAREWHPTKNGPLTPEDIVPGSHDNVWWRCLRGSAHEWQSTVYDRVKGNGCPFCAGKRATPQTSLQALAPDLASEWDMERNGSLLPDQVVPGSHTKVWWRCQRNPKHVWSAVIKDRVAGKGCPYCTGRKVDSTNSLQTLYPDLSQQWHPTKNAPLTPADVVSRSNRRVWWCCPDDPTHEWEAVIANRVSGTGCPVCANQQVTPATSLAGRYPHLAAEWHPIKNENVTPFQVVPGSGKRAWWRCSNDPTHEWEATIAARVRGTGCPMCSGRISTSFTALSIINPHLAAEWHPTRNGAVTPVDVLPSSGKKAWWRCSNDPTHEWEAVIASRTSGRGCPYCHRGWTIEAIRLFVASLLEHLHVLTPAELYLLFQQRGILGIQKKGKSLVNALITGQFPREELDKFVSGTPSLVDQLVEQSIASLEAHLLGQGEADLNQDQEDPTENVLLADNDEMGQADLDINEPNLPVVETRQVLSTLAYTTSTTADEEAVEFLVQSALAKIWKHAFYDEQEAVAQAQQPTTSTYSEQVRERFLYEYQQARILPLPAGYAFCDAHGVPVFPNLMQRLVAVRVRDERRIGNWSGTGAGKTLSALLASRVVEASLTVICCPNSVVKGWIETIHASFPGVDVQAKTFTPSWKEENDETWSFKASSRIRAPRYLVLNYEAFQQPSTVVQMSEFLMHEQVDCTIIDEIHYTKQRSAEDLSLRRKNVAAFLSLATERTPTLSVLGMSATPVINNLQEGKSMVELITGVAHNDLNYRPTVANCMALHQRLVRLGIRWMPTYHVTFEQREIPVECSAYLDEIRTLGKKGSPLALEQILTRARLPIIRQHIKPKTLLYTQLIGGIDKLLWDALVADGWKVGFYTGEEKSGLEAFLKGDLDVLIGSSAIGTGVDGLQQVCHQLIVNVLPWTAAEFEQLKGRLFRQGQQHQVTLVVPLTYATVNGQHWSWCESKMQRLHFKKSIADAAVDGVVPEGHLRTSAQAYQDLMAWLRRLDQGEFQTITRSRIVVPLPEDQITTQCHLQAYGTFSTMNRRWNQGNSAETHQRLQENPEEWARYHTLYREHRKEWAIVPYEEMIRWCQARTGKVIGDFGCGKAKLAETLSDRHTVYSFDHVAINDQVIACDMAHVPLDDETLDIAIFSLSLMGANVTDYLREAYRTLKLDGQLHIIEATARFSQRDQFARELEALGFEVIRVEDLWKFTHIRAIKVERQPMRDLHLHF